MFIIPTNDISRNIHNQNQQKWLKEAESLNLSWTDTTVEDSRAGGDVGSVRGRFTFTEEIRKKQGHEKEKKEREILEQQRKNKPGANNILWKHSLSVCFSLSRDRNIFLQSGFYFLMQFFPQCYLVVCLLKDTELLFIHFTPTVPADVTPVCFHCPGNM